MFYIIFANSAGSRRLSAVIIEVDKNGNVSEDEFNIDAHTFDAISYGLNDYDFASLKISKSDLGL